MNFPFVVWLGLIAAVIILAAIIVVIAKKQIKPKQRIKVHHTLALIGAAVALLHIILGLRLYL
ncbi:MAG: hypothetical protein K0B84_05490 [Firmicutes bacterium]|nr:hypothetical protein [Bacillota bacterium]